MMNEQMKLEKLLSAYAFAMYETALYLDGHPDCRKALMQYGRYKEKWTELKEKYECTYGPLTLCSAGAGKNGWSWVKEPWPWEYDGSGCGCAPKTETPPQWNGCKGGDSVPYRQSRCERPGKGRTGRME